MNINFKTIRSAFFSGLILIAPLGVTIFVIGFLIKHLGTPTRDFFFPFLSEELDNNPLINISLDLLSTLIVLVLITLIGWLSRFLIGRFAVNSVERLLSQVPLVKNIYGTVKQVVDTFSREQKAVFQRAVLIEFPRLGVYSLAFVTSEGKGEIQAKTTADIINVFVPTTPNPTSGYLLMVPKRETYDLEMSVAEGMKLIVSGGVVVPPYKRIEALEEDEEGNGQ